LIEVAVLDASPLILLARAQAVHLAQSLGHRWLVPEAVRDEIERKGPDDVVVQTLHQTPWLEVVTVDVPPEIASWELGAGESAVLALAQREANGVAVVDDKAARRCAATLGIRMVGTAGLLLVAHRKGIITEVVPLLDRLIGVGMYLTPTMRAEILRRAGKAP
jgi:predicted nucleic acid-binding protein